MLNGLNLLEGRHTSRTVLFPMVLVPLSFWLGGVSVESVLWLERLFSFGSVIVIYLLGKQLFGWSVGLVGAALAASSIYFLSFTGQILLDGIQSFLVLMSLWVTAIALQYYSPRYAYLAGICLGLAFWVKETTILLLPLPLILFLVIRQANWHLKRYPFVLAYWLGFATLAIWWWGYFYSMTGQIYLLNTWAKQGYRLVLMVLLVGGICLGGGLVLYWLLPREPPGSTHWLHRLLMYVLKIFQKAKASLPVLLTASGILILAVAIIVFSIIFLPKGNCSTDPLERLSAMWTFFWYNIVKAKHPLLTFAPLAWSLLGLQAIKHKRYRLLFIVSGLYVPLFFLISAPHYKSWAIRHLMPIYWLSYMVIGWALVWTISILSDLATLWASRILACWPPGKYTKLPLRAASVSLVILLVTLHSLQNSYGFIRANSGRDFRYYNTVINFAILDTVAWLSNNALPGTRLMVTQPYARGMEFFTKGYLETRMFPFDVDNTSMAGFKLEQGRLRLVSTRDPKGKSNLLYFHINPVAYGHYVTVSEDDLLNNLNAHSVDYLVIVSNSQIYYTFPQILDYFYDNDAFEQVFVRLWKRGITFRVFRVWRDKLAVNNYPLTVTVETMQRSLDEAIQDQNYGEYQVLEALGLKTILLLGQDKDILPLYRRLGDIYLANSQVDLACAEYRLAVATDLDQAKKYLPVARELASVFPGQSGPKVLLGIIYSALGQPNRASDAFSDALQLRGSSNETRAIAYRELGKLYLSNGENQQSVEYFERALRLSIVGAAETRQQLLIARGNLYQASGEIDQAILTYSQALYFDNMEGQTRATSTSFDPQPYDFVRQFDQTEVTAVMEASVHPAVFIIDDQPRPVLFAHPPAQASYTIQIPAGACLRFAPVLAPDVWHVGKGDGVQFQVDLETRSGTRYRLYSEYVDPKNDPADREWVEQEIDLSRWAGQTVTLTFRTGPGPNNDDRYDWAGWGELRIVQPVAYDFLAHYSGAVTSTLEFGQTYTETQIINYEARSVLFQHPTSRVNYALTLPQQSTLAFGLGMAPDVWSPDKGDGVEYNIYVRNPENPYKLYRVFQRYIDPKNNPDDRRWFDERVDLSRFGGQAVDIIFEALPGPAGDANYDWGGWSTPVLVDETLPGDTGAGITSAPCNAP